MKPPFIVIVKNNGNNLIQQNYIYTVPITIVLSHDILQQGAPKNNKAKKNSLL